MARRPPDTALQYGRPPGSAGGYIYDFGEGWHHVIFLESIVVPSGDAALSRCADGARELMRGVAE